jgi:AcrR family transcriptional regulator
MTQQQSPRESSAPRGTLNESRWEEVIDAAAEVFREKGYRAATLRDIAARLGMLKGSLYYYIETKEDLLFEILKRSHLQGLEFVQEDEAARSLGPAQRLEKLLRNWMDGLKTLPTALFVSEWELRNLEGPRRAEIVSLRSRIAMVPEGIIAAGIADGSFDPSIDPSVATTTMFRILNSTISWYQPDGRLDWNDLTDWYTRLMLGGLRKQKMGAG